MVRMRLGLFGRRGAPEKAGKNSRVLEGRKARPFLAGDIENFQLHGAGGNLRGNSFPDAFTQ